MTSIVDRPQEALGRAVPGHWEGDLITGALNKTAVGTLVDRCSRYTTLLHLPDGHGAEAAARRDDRRDPADARTHAPDRDLGPGRSSGVSASSDPRFRGRGCWGPPISRARLLGTPDIEGEVVGGFRCPKCPTSSPSTARPAPYNRAPLHPPPGFEGEVVGDPRFRGRGCWGPPILRARLLGVLAAQSAQHRRPRRPAPLPTSARFRTPPCPEPVPSALRTTPSPRPFWCPAGR